MSWIGWVVIGIFAFNILFFGALYVIEWLERRRRK